MCLAGAMSDVLQTLEYVLKLANKLFNVYALSKSQQHRSASRVFSVDYIR